VTADSGNGVAAIPAVAVGAAAHEIRPRILPSMAGLSLFFAVVRAGCRHRMSLGLAAGPAGGDAAVLLAA
jgi:hypothetical protein